MVHVGLYGADELLDETTGAFTEEDELSFGQEPPYAALEEVDETTAGVEEDFGQESP